MDVLQVKKASPYLSLAHLGELADVAVFGGDKQLHEVHYGWQQAEKAWYRVRAWAR